MKGKDAKIDAATKNKERLARSAKQALEAVQAVRAMAALSEQELMRYVRLQEKIKAASGGKLFLPDQPPTSMQNMRRFRAYVGMQKSGTTIIVKLIHNLCESTESTPIIHMTRRNCRSSPGESEQQGYHLSERLICNLFLCDHRQGSIHQRYLRLAQHLHAGAHRVKGPFDANSAAKAF
jgi:hypothetical protein